MADLAVPGYDVVELLGFGSGGEVWLAREQATGAPVALKRLHADADLAARDRLRREAAALAGVDHPHVVRLRSVVGAGESLVLVLDLATGGSLARLLATRGRLTPGEVVTVAVPLAQALAVVHGQGLVHGDVTPANVLFTADGRPVLSDLGVARLLGAPHGGIAGTSGFVDPALSRGAEPGPAGDVHGLAATCLAALTGHPPYDETGARVATSTGDSRLVAVLESALASEPADRPRADELAAAVYATAGAVPVQLGHGLDDGRPATVPVGAQPLTHRVAPAVPAAEAAEATPGRRRLGAHRGPRSAGPGAVLRRVGRRQVAVVGLLAGAVLMAVGGTAVLLQAGDPAPAAREVTDGGARGGLERTPVAGRDAGKDAGAAEGKDAGGADGIDAATAAGHSEEDTRQSAVEGSWAETLSALDATRSRAFADADAARLEQVYAPGAPAFRRDRSALLQLSATGLRADGLRLVAVDVRRLERGSRRVRLRVEDVMPAYRLVDQGATVVESRPGRGPQAWTVTLARVGAGWRVYDVERG
jgi:hypothetical protein